MMEELGETIGRIKPLADEVVDRATALNLAIEEASQMGLSVRIDVLEKASGDDGDTMPLIRARISKRIA